MTALLRQDDVAQHSSRGPAEIVKMITGELMAG